MKYLKFTPLLGCKVWGLEIFKLVFYNFQSVQLFFIIFIYYLLAWFSVCIQLTSKRLNRSGPDFLWDLTWTKGKVYGKANFRFCLFTKLDFWKFFNPRNFFLTMYTKRKCSQLKLESPILNYSRIFEWTMLYLEYFWMNHDVSRIF